MTPKEIKKDYLNRLTKAESLNAQEIQKAFTFREKVEISHYFEELTKNFQKKLEEAILLDIIGGLDYAPLYQEKRGLNKFVRCIRVQGKVKDYVKMDIESLKNFSEDIYIRQDDYIDEVYGKVSKETIKKVLK